MQIGDLRERGCEGQGLVEYSLILLLVAVVAVIGLAAFGSGLSNLFSRIVSSWPA